MQERIVDVTEAGSFGLVPPCADLAFDHRTCDYWENAERGSKKHRPGWLEAEPTASGSRAAEPAAGHAKPSVSNPFAPPPRSSANPFAPAGASTANAFRDLFGGGDTDELENPFAPKRALAPLVAADAPRKLALLGRGLAIFGSYAKVLLRDELPAAYAQFGPLSAYPRALRLRELYSQLPDAPLPAVITCVATTAAARGKGCALRLVEEICRDLEARGFAAVEAYPEAGAAPDATSAATVDFWLAAGFRRAVADEHFPVVRRELA